MTSASPELPRERYSGPLGNVVSASQLKMFAPSHKGCPRKWFGHYPVGLPRQQTPALREGIELHECIADRYNSAAQVHVREIGGGTWSRRWRQGARDLASAMLRHVAPPEHHLDDSEPTWFIEVPEIDTAIWLKPDLLARDRSRFYDWKSTSARHKRSEWVLQARAWHPAGLPDGSFSLRNDIQARVYAWGLMRRFLLESIEAEWIYGCKKFSPGQEPKTWSLKERFEIRETDAWVRKYVFPHILVMNALRRGWEQKKIDTLLLIPHNARSCEHTGKFCDLLGYCNFVESPVKIAKLHLPVIPA